MPRSIGGELMHGLGLVLFMTRGMSLAKWDALGTLDRETALYRIVAPQVGRVACLTYGGEQELGYSERLGGMRILPNRHGLPESVYALTAPLIHRQALANATFLKTNQVPGGLCALREARLYGRPLVARCGYLWSEVVDQELGPRSVRARCVARYERQLFRGADLVVVTTERLKQRVAERHGVPPRDITVIPNYVDTELFAPRPGARRQGSLLVVGRLSREKNLEALIRAMADLKGTSLTIVGDGPLRSELEHLAGELGSEVRFLGRLQHENLPGIMAEAEAFVLPSLYEGHPKAMLEAMAFGLPVIGTDVTGIREVVLHGETGLLCGTSTPELRDTIETLCGDEALRARLGTNAREAALQFSLQTIAQRELAMLENVQRRALGA